MPASKLPTGLEVPPLYRNQLEKAFAGTAPPRQAIKAHCLMCTNYDRATIADCTVTRCALRPYRPYQKGDEE